MDPEQPQQTTEPSLRPHPKSNPTWTRSRRVGGMDIASLYGLPKQVKSLEAVRTQVAPAPTEIWTAPSIGSSGSVPLECEPQQSMAPSLFRPHACASETSTSSQPSVVETQDHGMSCSGVDSFGAGGSATSDGAGWVEQASSRARMNPTRYWKLNLICSPARFRGHNTLLLLRTGNGHQASPSAILSRSDQVNPSTRPRSTAASRC